MILLIKKGLPLRIARIFFNKPLKIAWELGKRYFVIFNPQYLFFGGDKAPFSDLSIVGIPSLYSYFLPFFVIGLYDQVKNRKQKPNQFVLLWLLIAGITSGFVEVSPSTTKLLDFHFVVIIISVFGFLSFLSRTKKYFKKTIFIMSFFFLFSLFRFLIAYFLVYPQRAPEVWLPGLEKLITHLETLDYDHLFVSHKGSLELSYIYFAFYTPFEPEDFIVNAQYSPVGFKRAEFYKNYTFFVAPEILSLDDYNKVKASFGKVLFLTRAEEGQRGWKTEETFFFEGKPLWVLQKIDEEKIRRYE